MKLLLDENLSYRLVALLASAYPNSEHVDSVGLHGRPDSVIWKFALDNDFTIVSKDDDFRQLSLFHGAPPKVIWLSVGNANTEAILNLVNEQRLSIEAFLRDSEESLLILELLANSGNN